MDWLRRNWPDLLIGLALIAVIAGIVATLLTGGSFFPFGDEAPIADPSTTTPSVTAPATTDGSTAPSTTPNTVDGPTVAVLPPSDAANQDATTPPGAPDPAVTSDGDPATDPAASQSDGSNSATPATAAPESSAASSAAEAAPVTTAPATTAPTSTAPTSTAPAAAAATTTPASGESGLPTEPYRVSVGAFGVHSNAEAQAQRFRAAGYPVFLAQQDDLNLVLVGPYLQEADARRVAAEIAAGDYDIEPVVYHYQPDASGAAGATPDANSASTASPSNSAAPSVAAEGTRLQVGAYADRESASALIETLQSLGFDVATLDEGGLVKLVVGPFSGDALRDARIILDGAGIDSFARQ